MAAKYTKAEDEKMVQAAYTKLLGALHVPLNEEDQANVQKAFDLGRKAHFEQRRKSGETYFLHPIAVATICVEEIGLGPTAIICALLHDVVEDTEITLLDIQNEFGDRITKIVDGLTKLDGLHKAENYQAENLTKVLKGMLTDVRVVLIKMADRLHNLRTIKSMPHHKQLRIAAETNYVYTPLAHRLGLYAIKTEFQDITLRITHPEEFYEISNKLSETIDARNAYIEEFKAPVVKSLEKDTDIKFYILSRSKSIYSIWNKIRQKGVTFEGIYDLFAIRIIVDVPKEKEKRICWEVYTIVSDFYRPLPERLRDWITSPKANGYESLHTTVIGPDGRYVEVQIRSQRMDEIAERGFAAHWKYKGIKGGDVYDNWLNQVRETLEHIGPGEAEEFLHDMQGHFFNDEVHVFTPAGELKILPEGATALDFAFAIHSDVGAKCQVVHVNNKLVPISYKLRHGDQVKVITKASQKPRKDWLKIVVTSKAKARIRSALREEKRVEAEYGKDILLRKLKPLKADFETNVDMLARHFGYPNRSEYLAAIHHEQVELSSLKHFRMDGMRMIWETEKTVKDQEEEVQPQVLKVSDKTSVIINGEPGTMYGYSFANCCNPVHGDPIFAFVTTKEGIKIHRTTCPNATNLMGHYAYRCMEANWGNTVQTTFVTELIIKGVDTGVGVIQRITGIISTVLGINIRNMSIDGEHGYFEGRISVVVTNRDQLNLMIKSLKEIEGVQSIDRIG